MRKLFFALSLFWIASSMNAQAPQTFENPVMNESSSPRIAEQGGYYYFVQSIDGKILLICSKDLARRENSSLRIVWDDNERVKVSHRVMSPEIAYIDGKWYIYFTADDGDLAHRKTYVVENINADPMKGEFVFKGSIMTDPGDNLAMQASVFKHKGDLYMTWCGWEHPRSGNEVETQCIYIAKMKNPWTLASDRVLISKPEFTWERKYVGSDGSSFPWVIFVNEMPKELTSPDGNYVHIVYSASGSWTEYYSLGLLSARSDADLLNPQSWMKSGRPVFESSEENNVFAPGDCCFFKSPDKTEDWIMYTAHDTRAISASRNTLRMQKFTWDERGFPIFGTPVAIDQKLAKPSGTK